MTAGLITGELEAQVALLVQQELSAQQIDEHSVKSASSWSMVASEARNIEKSLERGTLKLLKWGALATGVLGGLGVLGVGASLFGLDRMAQNVMATRRSALGLGLPYGQYQSFLTNTARLVNPKSGLEGAVQAKYN